MLFCSLFCFPTLRRQVSRPLENQRGQGLIEYLVIVALVGVATIGIMRTVSSTVTTRFGNIAQSLGASKSDLKSAGVGDRRDLTNFMNGATKGGNSKSSGGLRDDARGTSNDSDSSSSGGLSL